MQGLEPLSPQSTALEIHPCIQLNKMGFEISVCLFSIDAASFSPIKSNIKTFLDKSLFDTVNFSHACIQHARYFFASRTFCLEPALIAPKQNQRVEDFLCFVLALGSDFAKSFAFVFGKRHDIFLHIQSSLVDYEDNIPHYLRHSKVDITLGFLFSRKAFIPSTRSCVVKHWQKTLFL